MSGIRFKNKIFWIDQVARQVFHPRTIMKMVIGLLIGVLTLSVTLPTVRGQANDRVTFEDSPSEVHEEREGEIRIFPDTVSPQPGTVKNRTRDGKNLFDWIGLGTGHNVDPYLARTNQACLNGDLAECFKSRALNSFVEFFDQQEYNLNDNVRVVRMPKDVVQEVNRQPYEYVGAARAEESEWDHLVKFATRKAEKFIKTAAFEVAIPSWVTGSNDEYAPRFLDEIADEIDTLENKKDSLFSRNRLKRLLIPMLIILKLFKLKLLLFIPLILGLASFKKFLGLMAIVIPGIVAFFKFSKPILQSYQPPVYTQSGLGFPHYKETTINQGYPSEHSPYHEHPAGYHNEHQTGGVSFGQDIAYQGYRTYENS